MTEGDPQRSPRLPSGAPGGSYARYLQEAQGPVWKRILDVQRPYRRHLVSLGLGRTLDLGCGIGRNLASLPAGSVGVDPDGACVAVARGKGLLAHTPGSFQDSGFALPGAFDSLLVAHVLEHVPPPEREELLRTYVAFVRPGGAVVLITPQERGFRSDPTHVEFADGATLERLAIALGCAAARSYSFPFPRWAGRWFRYNEFVLVTRLPG